MSSRAVVWADSPTTNLVTRCLDPARPQVAGSALDFDSMTRQPGAVAIVDDARLSRVEAVAVTIPVIAVTSQPFEEQLRLFEVYPWLSHVVSDATLASPHGPHHLNVAVRAVGANDPNLLGFVGAPANGRVSRITKSEDRHRRLDRLAQYLEKRKIGERTAALVRDVGEELLTNAIYNAPAAAGVFKGMAVPRTRQLMLSPQYACEMMYGISNQHIFIRVRDEFGSLRRSRLVDVLLRCAKSGMSVRPDESMGGAGLGLWRIFRVASVVVIAVHPGRSCEFLVCMAHRTTARSQAQRALAIQLFFGETEGERRAAARGTEPRRTGGSDPLDHLDDRLDDLDRSVTFVRS